MLKAMPMNTPEANGVPAGAPRIELLGFPGCPNTPATRATARHKEIAIRLAMGAARLPLVRQFLTESVLVALAGWLGTRRIAQCEAPLRIHRQTLPAGDLRGRPHAQTQHEHRRPTSQTHPLPPPSDRRTTVLPQ